MGCMNVLIRGQDQLWRLGDACTAMAPQGDMVYAIGGVNKVGVIHWEAGQ